MTENKLIDEIAMGVLGYSSEDFCIGEIKYEKILEDVKQLAGVTHTFAKIIDSVFNYSTPKGKNVGVVIDSPQGKCVVMKEEDFKIMYENNKKTEELKEQYDVVVGTSNKYADEVEKLKEENKKLKAEWEILNNFCPEEAENNGQAVVDWICKFFKIEDDFGNLEENNEEKEEYKLIIDGLGTMVENINQNACDVFNKLTQEYRNQFDEVHHK
tara:strand:- start:309 stop:947 length:639 start_codon:yes stop_codon:yes gene_type:complete